MSVPRFLFFRVTPLVLVLCILAGFTTLLIRSMPVQAAGEEGESNSFSRKTSYYSVDAVWPSVGIERVDVESKAQAMALVDDFLREVDEDVAALAAMEDNAESYLFRTPRELSVLGEAENASDRAVGIVWNIYSDTGGAHGMLEIITNNYDRSNGYPLLLEDLFLDPDLALVIFAREARTALTVPDEEGQILPDDMLRAGTEPVEENFRSFTITSKGIRLHFPPYQVAPWAAGPKQVDVPLDTLAPAKPALEFWGKS